MKKSLRFFAIKTDKGKLFFLLCTMVFFVSLTGTGYAIDDQVIQKKLGSLITKYGIPGAVLSYKIGDAKIHTVSAGYSSLSPKVSMSNNSLFLVGSITKSFTSALVLQMVERKKLQLNETLGSIAKLYGGEIKNIVKLFPSLGKMTVKELLNHTSGVPQSINTILFQRDFIKDPKKYYSSTDLIKLAMRHKIYFEPGESGKWSYTNTDYVLLGMIIEDVTKKSLLYNYNRMFFDTGLKNIYFATEGLIPKGLSENIAMGYMPIDSEDPLKAAFLRNKIVSVTQSRRNLAYQLHNEYNIFSPAASGVIANTSALVAWYYVLFQKGFLSNESTNEMLTVIKNGKYNHAGYGLGVTTHVSSKFGYTISHDGLEPGYSTIVIYFKKYKLTLAIATNSSNRRVSTFDVHTGAIIPGIVTQLLPKLIEKLK